MDDVFNSFKAIIDRLKASGRLSDQVMLSLISRIEWASVRGDLTMSQAKTLERWMDPTFRERYADVLELAAFGDLTSDGEREPDVAAVA